MPRRRKSATFEDCVSSEIGANYRRLRRDKLVRQVITTLRRRGMTDQNAEILFRNIASIPRDWPEESEPWKQAVKRHNRLGKKLCELAEEIDSDLDLGGWCFQISALHLNVPSGHRKGMRSLASLLQEAAASLGPDSRLLVKTSDGKILTPAECEQGKRPARKMPLTSYVLLEIFALLKTSIPAATNERREQRALNKETEILASVLLQKEIKPGTVTQLRKKARRRYAIDK